VELINGKLTLPSFALRVEAVVPKNSPAAALLETPVFFPYLPRQQDMKQSVPVTFLKRGLHVQNTFKIVTRFPFGFLQKARRIALKSEALVYPSVESNSELSEIFPASMAASRAITRGGAKICTLCANTFPQTAPATCIGKPPPAPAR